MFARGRRIAFAPVAATRLEMWERAVATWDSRPCHYPSFTWSSVTSVSREVIMCTEFDMPLSKRREVARGMSPRKNRTSSHDDARCVDLRHQGVSTQATFFGDALGEG